MKSLIIALCLFALPVFANTNYLAVAIRTDSPTADKLAVRAKLKVYFSDVTTISLADLPIWRQKNNHAREWYVVCFAIDVGTVHKRLLNKQAIDTWKDANLEEPTRVQVLACGMTPAQDIGDAGLEPIPEELP